MAVTVLWIASFYAGCGVIFAAAFVSRGVGVIDPVAEHAPLTFRVVIFPGAAALWPWMLLRWRRARSQR
jgi:hypothetical protein